MSNAVFPVLPGQTWPRNRVLRMPANIKRAGGRRYALAEQQYPTYVYRLNYAYLREADFATLASFWLLRGGAVDDFLFDDRDDNTASGQVFGTGDGSTTAFQLTRTWGSYTEPVYDFPNLPAVMVNGANWNLLPGGSFEVDSNADGLADGWSVNSNGSVTGIVASRVTGAPQDGSYEQRFDATFGATGSSNWVGLYSVITLQQQPGDVTVAVQARSDGSVNVQLLIQFLDANDVVLGTTYLADQAVTSSVRIGGTATPPDGTRKLSVGTRYYATATGTRVVRYDAFQVKVGTTALTYPGRSSYSVSATGLVTFSSAPSGGSVLSWSGKYYWRCAFAKGEQDFEEFMRHLRTTKSLEFETVGAP